MSGQSTSSSAARDEHDATNWDNAYDGDGPPAPFHHPSRIPSLDPTDTDSQLHQHPRQDKEYVLRNLVHVEQKSDWDCGVAAVAMCLTSKQREHLFQNITYFRFNVSTGFDRSTWTIDLCYILSYFGIECTIYTAVLGVNPDLRKETFYVGVVDRDTNRVSRLFRDAAKNGITAIKKCVELETLLELIRTTGPLIVLVNANLLECTDCHGGRGRDDCHIWGLDQSCSPWCPPPSSSSYQGHFILVVGFDLRRKLMYYRNPGLTDRICSIAFSGFELARSSFGTDYDVISVHLQPEVEAECPRPTSGSGMNAL